MCIQLDNGFGKCTNMFETTVKLGEIRELDVFPSLFLSTSNLLV